MNTGNSNRREEATINHTTFLLGLWRKPKGGALSSLFAISVSKRQQPRHRSFSLSRNCKTWQFESEFSSFEDVIEFHRVPSGNIRYDASILVNKKPQGERNPTRARPGWMRLRLGCGGVEPFGQGAPWLCYLARVNLAVVKKKLTALIAMHQKKTALH
jgi:hypothetical protein